MSRDTAEPSALAHEIINARPYAFLDDAPLEERRTQAVQTRRAGQPTSTDDLGRLDAAAIERVRDEARPDPRDADELHDALLGAGFLTARRSGRRCRGSRRSLQASRRHGPRRDPDQPNLATCQPLTSNLQPLVFGSPPSGFPRSSPSIQVRQSTAARFLRPPGQPAHGHGRRRLSRFCAGGWRLPGR